MTLSDDSVSLVDGPGRNDPGAGDQLLTDRVENPAGQDWASDFDAARRSLAALRRLPSGWNSEGAAPVLPEVLWGAAGLLDSLAGAGLSPPFVNPTPTGGVQFEWEDGDQYAEIEVQAAGAAEYFVRDGDEERTGIVFVGERLDDLLRFLRQMHRTREGRRGTSPP